MNQKIHTLRYYDNSTLIYINSYMFRPSLAYHQEVRSCIKESLDLIIITTVNTLTPTGCSNYFLHIRLYKSYIDKLSKVPHFEADNNV
jgi:hypothetical protein